MRVPGQLWTHRPNLKKLKRQNKQKKSWAGLFEVLNENFVFYSIVHRVFSEEGEERDLEHSG